LAWKVGGIKREGAVVGLVEHAKKPERGGQMAVTYGQTGG